jgi:hypothetical protein
MRRPFNPFLLCMLLFGFAEAAFANEFTDVIDSFDYEVGDPFDLNLSIGYVMKHKSGVIARENTTGDKEPHDWDYYPYQKMFNYKQVQHILDIGLEVGLFRDISLRFGLPLILNDARMLTAHKAWKSGRDAYSWDALPDDSGQLPLFGAFGPNNNSFKSPKRSGIDYFSVGLWVNPLDQSREPTFPNWTFFLEGRFGVGNPLRASCASGQRVPDGAGGTVECDDAPIDKVDIGGVGRGVHEVRFGTRLSRRIGMFDPFFGIDADVGIPREDSDFVDPENKEGQINTMPPITGTLDFGMEIVPWEVPDKHRRVAVGLGAGATFYSEGRDYTPLYDALGTSGYFLVPERVDFGGEWRDVSELEWTGMTDIENYTVIFGRWFVVVEPAKYIKFRIGGELAHETQHFITKTDMCSIDLMGIVTEGIPESCESYNLAYRPELDSPGSRFRAESTLIGRFFVDLTAMF